MNSESLRLLAAREQKVPWKKWGPYLSERQWGTVREDYSESGDAWGYFTHDHARSRSMLRLPFDDLRGHDWRLDDLMSAASYTRQGDDLTGRGLYLDVPAWGYHVFEINPAN